MEFYNNLDNICKSKNTSITTVLRNCGLSASKGTQWKNGASPTGDVIVVLAKYLNVSADKLLLGKDRVIPDEYQNIINIYDQLSVDNKEMAIKLLSSILDVQFEREMAADTITIRHSIYKVSAGSGFDLNYDGRDNTIVVKKTPLSLKADFAVTIDGDSMFPYYSDGDIVLVKKCSSIDVGQIGIFTKDSKGYIKQLGDDRLISLNPDYQDIFPSANIDIECVGLVLGKV